MKIVNYRPLHRCCLAAAMLVLLTPALPAQEQKKTYFGNMFLDPQGHICYSEALDENALNRIEYRADGLEVISIFDSKGEVRIKVEVTDFNSDGNPDLIYLEKDLGERSVRKANFFRGTHYQEHLKRHFGHALRTAIHPLIKDDPAEKNRAFQIEQGMKALDSIKLKNDDVGVYSAEGFFHVTRHKDIQLAFAAADTLISALRHIVEGDYRVLSQEAQIVKKYGPEIRILTGIDPANHAGEEPR